MSSAGRAASSSGCVARPRGREIGLIGFAAQIRRSSLIGSYVMETAEHREPCESRGSRTVLGARGGEIPPRDSTFALDRLHSRRARHVRFASKATVADQNVIRHLVPEPALIVRGYTWSLPGADSQGEICR